MPLAFLLFAVIVPACNWKVKPTYPKNRVAESLQRMLAKEYKMRVDTRRTGNTLQTYLWRVGLLKAGEPELRTEAADALEKALLCATRVALSTDAPLEFVEIKMADALTGATVSLWRYVPDIRDSMYQRIPEEEYYNRLVLDISVGNGPVSDHSSLWDPPMTLPEFLAKQVVFRAKRQSTMGLQLHEDLSQSPTLVMVIDNWPDILEQGHDKQSEVTDLLHRTAQNVIKSYGFHGFRGVLLRDARGDSLKSWPL